MGLALKRNKQENPDRTEVGTRFASREYLQRRNWLLSCLFDIALFLPLVAFICFYDLNSPSISYRDETTHIRAVQEMRLSGEWWLPTVRGEPYLNKPPFKMWLTFVPLKLFGESAFSYRFLDALSGILCCLSLYFFGRSLFQSRIAGIVSALMMIACPAYVFGHGIRKAVQDSMMIFLSTLACIAGWYFIQAILFSQPKKNQYRFAAYTGAAIGFAVMTKSVAGLVPLLIGGAFLLLSGKFFCALKAAVKPSLLAFGLIALIPGSYLIPHLLFTPGAYDTIIGAEVVDRAVTGYHNSENLWFYFIRLFEDRQGVAPEILLPSLLFCLWGALAKRSLAKLFVLLWAVVPVLAYTFYPSRLTWYVSPAFPGMSLAAGAFCAALVAVSRQRATSWWNGLSSLGFKAPISALFLCVGLWGFGKQLSIIGSELLSMKPRHRTDRIVEEMVRNAETHPETGKILSFDTPNFSLHESTYGGMIEPISVRANSLEEFLTRSNEREFSYVITSLEHFAALLDARHVVAYQYLRPLYDRNRWMLVATLRPDVPHQQLTEARRTIDFGQGTLQDPFGLRSSEPLGETFIQRIFGNLASITVAGDSALKNFGSLVTLNMLGSSKEPFQFVIRLNTTEVFRKEMARTQLKSQEFEIPPGVWKSGVNHLYFEISRVDGQPVEESDSFVALNWLTIALQQPKAPATR